MAIETQDIGLVTMSSGIREGRAQFLRDLGRFDEAIATQREVIAGHEKLLAKKRSANSLGTRGFSQIIMGTIARDAKKRDLACSAWRQAVRDFSDLENADELAAMGKASWRERVSHYV